MKRYTLSLAASLSHVPEHPERTAKRDTGWDVMYQVWPSRGAMLQSLKMQARGATTRLWRAYVERQQ